ncbi:hypothetical protein BH24BAC1_BH24BAC1_00900 [soil metagenome]
MLTLKYLVVLFALLFLMLGYMFRSKMIPGFKSTNIRFDALNGNSLGEWFGQKLTYLGVAGLGAGGVSFLLSAFGTIFVFLFYNVMIVFVCFRIALTTYRLSRRPR